MDYPYLAPGARLLAVKLKDQEGNALGKVKEWMMDVDAGKVVYVLAALGESDNEYTAIPWDVMQADKENGGYKVKASADQLMSGPRISTDKTNDLVTDTAFLDRVFQHYGSKSYWKGNEAPQVDQSTAAVPVTSGSEPANQVGQPSTNDLKEQKDEQAAATDDPLEGRTNVEHGQGSGYGG